MKKTFRLFLLRHGNTFESGEKAYQIGCQTDLPLTAKGLAQAEKFATFLQTQSCKPFVIYSGTLQRQTQTAKIIAEKWAQPHLTHDALNEIDYGAWEGKTHEVISVQWPKEYQAWQEQAIWPQSVFNQKSEDHLALLKGWIQTLERTIPPGAIVVAVTSGGTLKLILQLIPQLAPSLMQQRAFEQYKVSTGHYSELLFNEGTPTLVSWDQAC